MLFSLSLLRTLAEQQAHESLYQACIELSGEFDLADSAVKREANLLYALSCGYTGRTEQALQVINSQGFSAQDQALTPQERLYLSAVYLSLADYLNAECLLRDLQAQAFSLDVVMARIAYCRLMMEDVQEAYRCYLVSLDINPHKIEVRLNLCLLLKQCYGETGGDFLAEQDLLDELFSHLHHIKQELQLKGQDDARWARMKTQHDTIRLEVWVLGHDYAQAEAWLFSIREQHEEYVHYLMHYAQQLEFTGRHYLAEAAILKALQHQPTNNRLWRVLMELANAHGRLVDAQYYALRAKQTVSYGESESALTEVDGKPFFAGETKATFLQSDAYIERIKTRFSAAFIATHQWSSSSSQPSVSAALAESRELQPIFILGLPYSGVELVEDLLQQHKDVGSLGRSSHINCVVQGLDISEREKGSLRNYPDSMDDLTPETGWKLAQGVASLYASKVSDGAWVLDTNLDNIFHVGFIKCLFPNAKFIFIKRSPSSLLKSQGINDWLSDHPVMSKQAQIKRLNGKQKPMSNVTYWLGQHLAQFESLCSHWKKSLPESIHQLSYESLMENPNLCFAELSSFLCLPSQRGEQQEVRLGDALIAAMEKHRQQKVELSPKRLSELMRAKVMKPLLSVEDMTTLPMPNLLRAAYHQMQEGDLQKAEKKCKTLLMYLPEHAPAFHLLSEVYLRADLLGKSLEALQTALALAPWKQRQWNRDLERVKGLIQQKQGTQQLKEANMQSDIKEVF